MIFWSLLLIALLTMVLLYLFWGHKRVWITIINYGVFALLAGFIIYQYFPGLYTLDLVAFFIPYLLLFPLHFSFVYIINNYVLPKDQKQSKNFVAIYNRVLNILWFTLFVLVIGIGLSLFDGIFDEFDAPNIWSLSITGVIAIINIYGLGVLGYKKKFSYILIAGKSTKKIYIMYNNKSRISVNKLLNVKYAYARGIYQEGHEIQYLYYIDEDINVNQDVFKLYQSELYEYLKDHIETHEKLEHAYNEYIEKKSSIS